MSSKESGPHSINIATNLQQKSGYIKRNIQRQSHPKYVLTLLTHYRQISTVSHTRTHRGRHSTLDSRRINKHKQLSRSRSLRPSDQLILISSKANNGRGSGDCVGPVIIVCSYTTPVCPLGSLLLQPHLVCVCVCMRGGNIVFIGAAWRLLMSTV